MIFRVSLLQYCELYFFGVRNFCRPPKTPLGAEISDMQKKFFQKMAIFFLSKNPNMAKKIISTVWEYILGPGASFSKNFWSAEISATLGRFLKF